MSSLNELFAELKSEIVMRGPSREDFSFYQLSMRTFYRLDELINNGEFAREEQDNYVG